MMFRSPTSKRKLRHREKAQPARPARCHVEDLEGRRLLSSVVNLTLVDAATDRDIMPLSNGQTINLQQLPSRQLNVRADVEGTVGSVRFAFDGNSNYRTESGVPFALGGDDMGDLRAMTFSTGAHTLSGTPYAEKNGAGTAGAAKSVSFNIVDQETPAAPTGLTAQAASSSSIDLAWTDASSDESGFYVERSTDGGNSFTRAATLGAGAESWTDTGRAAGATYHYRLLAYNAVGSSAASNTASATTSAAVPDPAPDSPQVTGLMLVNADNNQDIQLLADGVALNLASLPTRNLNVRVMTSNAQSVRFALDGNANYRVESGQPFALAGDNAGSFNAWTPGAGAHTLTVTPFSAKGATGDAGAAAKVSFTVTDDGSTPTPDPEPSVPASPTGLAASAASASRVNLNWTDAASDESGFRIERSTDGNSFTQIASVGADAESYAATGLSASAKYYFRVRAYNSVGNSGYSNVASATTAANATPGKFPDASTTGPTDRSALRVVSGNLTITQDGAVVENVHLKGGMITVQAQNVTLRNFVIENPQTTGAAIKIYNSDIKGTVIEDGEIFGGNATNGVAGSNYTARRLHIHHTQSDAFRVRVNVTIEGCYIHDLALGEGAHGDGVQMYPTDGGNMRIIGNHIDARGANAALFQVDGGWHIEGNFFQGGNYTIQATGEPANKFINNTFARNSKYGPIRVGAGDRDAMGAWTGNVWADNGQPVTL